MAKTTREEVREVSCWHPDCRRPIIHVDKYGNDPDDPGAPCCGHDDGCCSSGEEGWAILPLPAGWRPVEALPFVVAASGDEVIARFREEADATRFMASLDYSTMLLVARTA